MMVKKAFEVQTASVGGEVENIIWLDLIKRPSSLDDRLMNRGE